jgi:hypothetical protein
LKPTLADGEWTAPQGLGWRGQQAWSRWQRAREELRVPFCVMPTVGDATMVTQARVCSQVIAESGSPSGNEQRPFYEFLEGCLRHKAEMVIFEAARAICNMKDVSTRYSLRPMR